MPLIPFPLILKGLVQSQPCDGGIHPQAQVRCVRDEANTNQGVSAQHFMYPGLRAGGLVPGEDC